MTTSVSPLKPMKLRDKNGNLVTRWVRVLEETGETAISVPEPSIPASHQAVDSTLWRLLPEWDEETEMLMDIFGQEWDYTDIFTKHALEHLPTKTMNLLHTKFNDDSSPGQCFIAVQTYSYIRRMSASAGDDSAQTHYDDAVRDLNNALFFYETLNDLTEVGGIKNTAADLEYVLNWALASYEQESKVPLRNKPYNATLVDYSKLPRAERDRAVAYLVSFRLTQYFGSPDIQYKELPEGLESLLCEYPERRLEIMKIVKERGIDSIAVIGEQMSSATPALNNGVL